MPSSGTLQGHVVIVSGAGRGIGKAIAARMAAAGAAVLLFARTESELRAAVQEIETAGGRAAYEVADASAEADVARVVAAAEARFGAPADIFVANAGWYPCARLQDVTLDLWRSVIDANLTSAFLALKISTPPMIRGGRGGRVVLISSITGARTGLPGYAAYAAAKAGLLGLMKTAAVELAKHAISVNAVLPGNIATPALVALPGGYADSALKAIPAGRLGGVGDVADAALYLACAGPFVTGAEVVVDGGQTLPESHHAPY
ncbi:MAG: short chain dehydrogenase [Monoraphidium minutum]|nr:MAG: short chain dehydrogenase [Monoraphidium minutum]